MIKDRYAPTIVWLNGLLGEATPLRRIHEIEAVVTLMPEQSSEANAVGVLREHLDC
jgi:hypothetical protein